MAGDLKYQVYTKCFVCDSENLTEAYDFGNIPLADFLIEEETEYQVPEFPLHLNYCGSCGFLFLKEGVSQEVLFNENYPYYTSVNPSLTTHFYETFLSIGKRKKVDSKSVAIEAASNDGYLLEHFKASGAKVLGIEPSGGPAAAAQKKGINTVVDFFTNVLAVEVRTKGWQADFFIGNNVLAHVKDPNDFIRGVKQLLKPDGLGVFEFPYKGKMFEKAEFDTIFHQHLCYYSLLDVNRLFSKSDLKVVDVEEIEVHGGSLRVFVQTNGVVSENVRQLLKKEEETSLNGERSLMTFIKRAEAIKTELNEFIGGAITEGKVIYGYGAAGKANTLLSFCKIGSEQLPFIIDISPHKQHKYFSTGKIPIRDIEFLRANAPDYVLILAWNFSEDIIKNLRTFMPGHTKYVIPIPALKIV